MNKKVLSAILFSALFAGTGTFTSCIDTDEPAGIEELRGAKAELIRAKVAVEQANAAKVLAEAEVEKAKAAKENAEAEIKKAVAAIKQAEAEKAEITNDSLRAELDKVIAQNEATLKENALRHQATMLELQQQLAEAQRKYDLALAEIEIAKAVCSEKDKMTLAQLKLNVYAAQLEVDKATKNVAKADSMHYVLSVNYKYYNDIVVEFTEKSVANAEQALKDAEDDLAKWQGYVNEDTTVVDWMAKVTELVDSVAGINDYKTKKEVELNLLKQSEEYALLVKAKLDAAKEYNNQKIDSVYSYKYFAQTPYTDVLVGSRMGNANTTEADAKNASAASAIAFLKDTTNDNSGYIAGLEREIASYTTEYTYWLDSIAANDSARLAEIKTASDSAIIKWKGALKSYQEADATVGAKKQAAETALAAFDALTTKNAKNIDAARKAILAYYTAAKANGAKFNKVPAAQGRVTVEVAGAPVYKYPYAMEDVMTVLADTTKTYSAYVEFDVNFFGVVDANSEETTTVDKYYNATSKTDVTLTYMEDVIATADKAIGEGVPAAAGTFLKELQDSSYIAFGPAANYINAYEIEVDNEIETNGYLHKQPTAADAKFVGYDNAGNYGRYLASLDEEYQFKAKNYKAIVADLQAAVAYWTAKWNIMVADRAAAQVAMEATAEAETEYAKQWNDREEELDELKNRIDRLSNMAGILKEAIMAYLPDEYKAQSTPLYDPKGFTNFLKNQVVAAQAEVDNKKLALAAAQYNAELALDGKYDVYSEAKQNLDAAMAELEAAQAKLDAALADLEKGLAIIAAVNGAE